MDTVIITIGMGLLGAFFGSFAAAQVWRLRAKQLIEDKAAGEPVNKGELQRLKELRRPVSEDRSECLLCHHQLAWYDLLPIISWLALKGRCRYCKAAISRSDFLVEVGLGIVFALSWWLWPTPLTNVAEWTRFVLWLAGCISMAILFVYDARWYLLPFGINMTLIALGVLFALITLAQSSWQSDMIWSLLVGCVLLSGLYYLFSLAGWVGLGDSILGLGLALLLGSWSHSLLALFLANLFGCLALIPLALQQRARRSMHIPFGPFLILGTFVTMLWGDQLITMFVAMINAPLMV